MKLINKELKGKIWDDVHDKVLKHVSYHSPVRDQIGKNLAWGWNNNLIRLKIDNPKMNIGNDLNETT